jgi:hypothetical protein
MDTERQPLLRRMASESSFVQPHDVYGLLCRCKNQLTAVIDTPLSQEQLSSPRIVLSVIRPLEEEYYQLDNPSILYCLFVTRVHFLKQASTSSSFHSVNATRAALCEVLAICVLRRIYDEEEPNDPHSSRRTLLKLANVLARTFDVWQGAPSCVLPDDYETRKTAEDSPHGARGQTSALELAIVTTAKNFIRSQPCQRVVQGIYEGQIVYSAVASYHILPDNYKRKVGAPGLGTPKLTICSLSPCTTPTMPLFLTITDFKCPEYEQQWRPCSKLRTA